VLGPEGLLSRRLEGFEFRTSQLAMARMIDRGLREEKHVITEAGTLRDHLLVEFIQGLPGASA